MPSIPRTDMDWIHNGLQYATERLYSDGAYYQAIAIVAGYQRDAIAALTPILQGPAEQISNYVPLEQTVAQRKAHIHLAGVEAMATQFQNHLEVIEASTYKDRDFYRVDRWFDPTAPITVDPGPDLDPD